MGVKPKLRPTFHLPLISHKECKGCPIPIAGWKSGDKRCACLGDRADNSCSSFVCPIVPPMPITPSLIELSILCNETAPQKGYARNRVPYAKHYDIDGYDRSTHMAFFMLVTVMMVSLAQPTGGVKRVESHACAQASCGRPVAAGRAGREKKGLF